VLGRGVFHWCSTVSESVRLNPFLSGGRGCGPPIKSSAPPPLHPRPGSIIRGWSPTGIPLQLETSAVELRPSVPSRPRRRRNSSGRLLQPSGPGRHRTFIPASTERRSRRCGASSMCCASSSTLGNPQAGACLTDVTQLRVGPCWCSSIQFVNSCTWATDWPTTSPSDCLLVPG
jgi:hypothetical protein